MSDEDVRWEVYVEREDFERFREDPEIAALLNLARVVNMLNFCHHALLVLPKDDSPASSRAMLLELEEDVRRAVGPQQKHSDGYLPIFFLSRFSPVLVRSSARRASAEASPARLSVPISCMRE